MGTRCFIRQVSVLALKHCRVVGTNIIQYQEDVDRRFCHTQWREASDSAELKYYTRLGGTGFQFLLGFNMDAGMIRSSCCVGFPAGFVVA